MPILRTATNLVLHGGLWRGPDDFKMLSKLFIYRSPGWKNGILTVNKIPYYRLTHDTDNCIEIKSINNHQFLSVNGKDIYDQSEFFGYTINIQLTNTPYVEFFRYIKEFQAEDRE